MSPLALTVCLVALQLQEELSPLGTNLAPFSEHSTQWPLVDAMKMASPWKSTDGAALDIDEHGNVKSLKPGQAATTVVYPNGRHPKGKYTLKWSGTAEFGVSDGATLTVESPNQASIDVTGDKGIALTLKSTDPGSPARNVKLLMPGYGETSSDEPFHPIFLQRMSLYRVLRFADWQRINNSPQGKWSDRSMPDDATYQTVKGVPLEVMIDLANEKSATPWFCVPHQADDEYVKQMAMLIKSRLRPNLRIAIEFSNECWSQKWAQTAYCQERGLEAKLADSKEEAGLRFYAERSLEVFAIFEEVFGGKGRLLRVLSADAKAIGTAETIIGHKRAASKADLLAIAPYFGETNRSGSLDVLFTTLSEEITGPLRDSFFAWTGLTNRSNLRLVAYGGGQGLVPTLGDDTQANLFAEANRSPKMSETYTAFLKAWRTAGGMLFVHTYDCGPWTDRGYWGTIEHQDQDPQSSMKNRALIQYALFPDR